MSSGDLGDSESSQPLRDSFTSAGTDAGSFTFLVSDSKDPSFSHDDLSHKVDKFAHTRTKRKRTSPEDQAILEAEYQRNSKPDRATRDNLVGRVSLSEKEIQIWFQNRRQMTRKKKNTWQPNEITSIIRSSQEYGTDTRSSAGDSSSSQQSPIEHSVQSVSENSQETLDIRIELEDAVRKGRSEGTKGNVTSEHDASIEQSAFHPTSTSEHCKQDTAHIDRLIKDSSEGDVVHPAPDEVICSSLSNNVDEPNIESTSGTAFKQEDIVSTSSEKVVQTSSKVRLSMSLDGKASVILKGNTPSPPSKQQLRGPVLRSGLQRSQSLLPSNTCSTLTTAVSRPNLPVPRVHGRSRDVRTWEFYCDTDVRESLTKTADHDQRGSAAGPIQLIRSGSAGRQPLGSSTMRQNTQLHGRTSSKRKAEVDGEKQKQKLARTTSSHARLQSTKEAEPAKADCCEEMSNTQPTRWKEPSGDSDKENWEPGSQSNNHRPRPSTSRAFAAPKRGVLQENNTVPSHSSSLGMLMEREKHDAERIRKASENDNRSMLSKENVADDEVSEFMRGSGAERGEDDLDAVQNLLSLSQGNWA